MAQFKVCFLKSMCEPGQIIPMSGVWNKRRAISQQWGKACHQYLLAGYYVSRWFSFSLSPGHLINGPAGGIPGRVIWNYIIKSHCQGFPTSCELFTPWKSPWVDPAYTLMDEAIKSKSKRTDQTLFPTMSRGLNNLPSEWTITEDWYALK